MSSTGGFAPATHGPYPPTNAGSGLTPSPIPDIPVVSVLIPLFFIAGVTHLITFFINQRAHTPARPRKFLFSLLLMGFSITRIAALSLRLAWARDRFNVDLAIAAGVLTNAGVLLVFVVNLILAARVLQGCLPSVGWSRRAWWALRGGIGTVVAVLVMVVVCNVHTLFTLDPVTRRREREVLLFAGVYMAVLAALPAVGMTVLFAVMGRGGGKRWEGVDMFGTGKMTTKMLMLTGTSLLLTIGAGFRCGVNFAARPTDNPGWWHGKGPFYAFNFAIELIVTYTYIILRFDRRFCVPDGCSGPGDFTRVIRQQQQQEERADETEASESGAKEKRLEGAESRDGIGREGEGEAEGGKR
ncbi:hypothetical protein VTK26DRAFT_5825 [Humicola hyalothermophila]